MQSGTQKIKQQVIDQDTRTITYYEYHLFPHIIDRIRNGGFLPQEVKMEHIGANIDKAFLRKHRHWIEKEGYRVYLNFDGKNYLIIFNKNIKEPKLTTKILEKYGFEAVEITSDIKKSMFCKNDLFITYKRFSNKWCFCFEYQIPEVKLECETYVIIESEQKLKDLYYILKSEELIETEIKPINNKYENLPRFTSNNS